MATGGGTGTPVVGGVTAFTELIDRIETAVADPGNVTWSTAQLATFLNDAVRDYSQFFPRIKTQEITAVGSQRVYDLAADCLDVVSVEWPADEAVPQYLARMPFTSSAFWGSSGQYDVVRRHDQADADELWITDSPEIGEDITVMYQALHVLISNPAAISGNGSVPVWHEHILIRYVVWQCTLQLQMAEQQSPTSNSSLLMSMYATNAGRARRDYETAVQQALWVKDGRSEAAPWYLDNEGKQY